MRISREEFLTSLELLRPGLATRETAEQSSCIVFRDGWMMTYNEEVAVSYKADYLGKMQGAIAAAPLLDLLHKMTEEEIEIEQTKAEFLVTGKRRQAGIRMDAEINLPIDSVEHPEAWSKLPEDFAEAVQIVEQCAGKDDSKFELTCVHFHPKWVEACDNFQATRYRIVTGFQSSSMAKRDSVKHIVSLGMTEFAETETWMHFRNAAGLILSCRRYQEDYPSLKELLAVEGTPATLPRGLAEAAERAEVFSSQNADEKEVTIELTSGKLKVVGRGPNGWYRETKKLKYDGPDLKFNISPKMLSQIVRKHTECRLSPERLMVQGERWKWVTCLGKIEEIPEEETDDND